MYSHITIAVSTQTKFITQQSKDLKTPHLAILLVLESKLFVKSRGVVNFL